MFWRIKFRFITTKDYNSVKDISLTLKKEGFEIYDLKESTIVSTSNGRKVLEIYIICCKGKVSDYNKFKNKHQLSEISHEGFRTLM